MDKPPQIPKTDLRIVLENIDSLLRMMRCSVNAVSGQLLAMTAAVECITLTQKLRQTLQRWQVYLPFHESRDVNFKVWVDYLSRIHKSLNSRQSVLTGAPDYEYYPDIPFCMDLIDILGKELEPEDEKLEKNPEDSQYMSIFAPRYAESELQRDVEEYVGRVTELVDSISIMSDDDEQELRTRINKQAMSALRRQYAGHLHMLFRKQMSRQLVEQELLPKMRDYLNAVIEQPAMAYCLDMALDTLIDVMRQIDKFFSDNDMSSEQLLRLSMRLYYRYCPEVQTTTASMVHRWSTEWPIRKRKQRADEKRRQLFDGLSNKYGALGLNDYIDIDRPSPLTDYEFGRFLFANRHNLETEDVKSLFHDCFLIQQLNRLIDPAGTEADINAARLDHERKEIYNHLSELVRKAQWQGGMTAERIHHCFGQLLINQPSEIFWSLLTSRRNCNEEFRSLKLTWLNLVGYFRSRDYLKGGSLTLCRYFFPDNTDEGKNNYADHNAVNKGAGDRAGNDFHELIKMLDRYLKS